MKTILLVLLSLFFITPYLYSVDVVDNISVQFLYFSIFNLVCFLYLTSNYKKFQPEVEAFKKSKIAQVFFLFVFWGLITFLYAINPNEVIVVFSRWFNVFLGVFNIYLIISEFKNKQLVISSFIVITLSLEVLVTLTQFYSITSVFKYDFSYASKLLGLASNKNVNSASIVSKLPFLLYFIHTNKKYYLKIISQLLLFASVFCLMIISSRATFISLFLILIFYSISYVFIKKGSRDVKKQLLAVLVICSLGVIVPNIAFDNNNSIGLINRLNTIQVEGDESTRSRVRYYGQAIESFTNNPLGIGLGNWKIESIKYDSKQMNGYVVQYHVHNDFLQNLAELGFIGFFLYGLLFLQIGYLNLRRFLNNDLKSNIFYLSVLLSIGAYFVDSNLNFPQARLANLVVFITLIVSTIISEKKNTNEVN